MFRAVSLSLLAALACFGCSKRDLRGFTTPSPDSRTYLAIVDDGHCGPLSVDGKAWQLAIGKPGPIEPGRHTISCGTQTGGITFSVPPRVIFHFDYWGP